jgi:outer membrane protein insertion porin family
MKLLPLVFFVFTSLSQASSLSLKEVEVNCPSTNLCKQRTQRLMNLKGEYRSLVHLKDTLRIMASDGGYERFSFDLFKDDGVHELAINFKMKPIIEEIEIQFIDRDLDAEPSQLLTVREGEFFESQKLQENIDSLKRRLEGIGFPDNTHRLIIKEKDEKIKINIAINLGPPRIFKSIKSDSSSSFVSGFLRKKFYSLYNKPFDFSKFKSNLDEAQKELFNYGYYLISLDFKPILKGKRVILDINVSNDQLYVFDFKNIKSKNRDDLMSLMTNLFKQYKRPLTPAIMKQSIEDYYQEKALLSSEVEVTASVFENNFKEKVNLYRIEVNKGQKTSLGSVTFTGNTLFSDSRLQKIFEKEAFELASIGYYDEEYFKYFSEYIRNQYLLQGYVQVKILGPNITLDEDKKVADVDYVINEGRRAFVKEINYTNLPVEFEEAIRRQTINKVGTPFNPIAMVEDIKKVATLLQENGYYFAEVLNANDESIVQYSKSGTDVFLNFIINPGQFVRLNRVLFLGNNKTQKRVLSKKILLEKGDLITPSKTYDIETALSATGLFNSVSVTPVRHNSKSALTDLVVKVTERDYGLIEFAPGYRTDLGLKLSGTISYLNIGGMNQSLTLRSQVNQRLNYQTFDPRRRREKKQLLEHNTSLNFNRSDLFDTLIDLGMGLSYQRKRFYSFDADIQRFNTTLTRDLTPRLSSSVRYQIESITQWDASEERDNGRFRIGAFTPNLTYDLRNSQINPIRGAFFNLSSEFANPYFLSQDKDDLTVNYYKLISRNRFYLPYENGTVAISLVAGMQENLAKDVYRDSEGQTEEIDGVTRTEGYIPNIKVFRLTGMDIVRGFNDEEINRLPDGRDISEARIQNRAFLANFKLEPRYFLTDNFILGAFYDAGRVFVNQVDLGDLRESVGLTFKILTPVGTLDFDYGIKLLRKKNADGTLEDPGRFHVSIGFF